MNDKNDTPRCNKLAHYIEHNVPPIMQGETAADQWPFLARELERELNAKCAEINQLKCEVAAALDWSWDMEEVEVQLRKLGISSDLLGGSDSD